MNANNEKLNTQPYKGARDFYPEEMQLRNYIFEKWKKVAKSFGFEEYDFPILEPLEIFAAKTGEEIVNQQLFNFEDKAGRKLAIRPELTPGTVRMLAQKYNELPRPVKWFMIGNNWRYEQPQKGRGREFYQWEVNSFGIASPTADFEIFQIIIATLKEFGADENMFDLKVSDRRLISSLLQKTLELDENTSVAVRRTMDKRAKVEKVAFFEMLTKAGLAQRDKQEKVEQFMNSDFESLSDVIDRQTLDENKGYNSLRELFSLLEQNGLSKYVKFDPSIIRGFDYSDGLVYEVFDKNPANNRSMFGGERFDKLINIFGDYELPATGFAMGDWTLVEFLKAWNLMPQFEPETEYFVTLWPEVDPKYLQASLKAAAQLRISGKNVFTWLEPDTKLDKQLKYADKKGYKYAVIIGEEEISKGEVVLKDLNNRTQQSLSLKEFNNL